MSTGEGGLGMAYFSWKRVHEGDSDGYVSASMAASVRVSRV